ncbi:cysteine--tRNA ligase [Candidatus Nitronereus thalassa]|uniref:Cysteine--tRNA ligase n=1 Tax=Candidatus Nitronereus thalassa TaxID=3020898 RepID=A0ABU3K6M8_9BACT|nr:cysteine--tRNA ligase [Candidatus Nitronereus thalassa]MDT7042024.1 cysteine--tRNA ligase [Candidatus Nitronereus thalassa]
MSRIPHQVGMYVCGVTVYDECHLGHARSAIVFDLIRRYLTYRGYEVNYVKNFTDIDDKILNRAVEESRPWNQVTEKYVHAYYRDMNRLGILNPNIEPRATEHMTEIIEMIKALVDKGHAYQVDHDVFYEVSTFATYGRLGRRKLEDMQAGARVEVDSRKRDPMDFALWKGAKTGEPAWDSPWGAGRPGWHIECSAMSVHHLGDIFDIHGGGKDLIFPHHENEIAQSCAATGQEFARYWVHNGFVTIDEEKMSKSLGNFFTIREIFEKSQWKESVTSESLRYLLLSTHYRSDINFSDQALSEAKSALDNFYGLFQRLEEPAVESKELSDIELAGILVETEQNFEKAMDDDFNTPKVLGEFHRLRGILNKFEGKYSDQGKRKILKSFRKWGTPIGLFQVQPKDWQFSPIVITPPAGALGISGVAPVVIEGATDEWINHQIESRRKAREEKNFQTADQIRKDLASKGIILEDRPDGSTRWKR